jgi:hypothetical protein
VKPACPTIKKSDRVGQGFIFKAPDRVDADAFIAHEQISDAEDQRWPGDAHFE